jgi:hypothetical protein
MRKIIYILIAVSLVSCIDESTKIDDYVADTTLAIWAGKFNEAIYQYTGGDTIELGVDNFEIWSQKINVFIDSTSNDTIIYGSDNFEAWRTKFNTAVSTSLINTSNLVVQTIGDTIRFSSKFTDTTDLWVDFYGIGDNNITNLGQISFKNNTDTYPSNDLTGSRNVYKQNLTDIIGPYRMYYNASGGFSQWVGGTHPHLTYVDGSGNALVTGYTDSLQITAEKSIGNSYYDNDSIIIQWKNYILNYPTIQDLGYNNGDTAFAENIRLTVTPRFIGIENEIEFSGQADSVVVYYGHQWSNSGGNYDDSLHFIRGQSEAWEVFGNNNAGLESQAPDYLSWITTASDNSHRVYGFIDRNYGLAEGNSIDWNTFQQGFSTTSKTYYYQIAGNETDNIFIDTVVRWKGGWLFTPEIDTMGSNYYDRFDFKGAEKLIASTVSADTLYINGIVGERLQVISMDSSFNIDDNSFPLVVESDGYGAVDGNIVSNQYPYSSDSVKGIYDFNFGRTLTGTGLSKLNDLSGNNNDIFGSADPDWYDLGDTSGIYFNGVDDDLIIHAGSISDFNPGVSSFSIDFTYKGTNDPISRMIAIYQNSITPYWQTVMRAGGAITLSLRDTEGDIVNAALLAPSVNDNEWHHIAYVIDKAVDSVFLYVDGIKHEPSTSYIGTIDDITNNSARFGMNHGKGAEWHCRSFNYYAEALTNEKILELYNFYKVNF